MFAFDGLFTDEDVQSDVASSALMESIHGVVSGVDGCLFAFGHASLGKRIKIRLRGENFSNGLIDNYFGRGDLREIYFQ